MGLSLLIRDPALFETNLLLIWEGAIALFVFLLIRGQAATDVGGENRLKSGQR